MSKGHILVVDDDPNVLTLAEEELQSAGYTVEAVLGGTDAMELLEDEPCDIVFTDYMLAGTDGITLCREIKKRFPKVQVVLMSAFPAEMEKHKREFCESGGFKEIVEKPLAPGKLLAITQKILSAK